MKKSAIFHNFSFVVLALVAMLLAVAPAKAQSSLSEDFAATNEGYSESERVGREIWLFATAFNARFFTYGFSQRLGGAIDWYRILAAKNKGELFQTWGAIPNPDCCVPGSDNCPAQSLDETYGFPWCPGDEELLAHVGKSGYRDPACDLVDAPFDPNTPHGPTDQRQSTCDLQFGTSTGALGLRKFPNPRFDPVRWKELNGSLGTWENYGRFLSDDPDDVDSRKNRLFDGSVEPPFLIGMSCGGCHIAYDPLNPPADPDNPKWENIDGLVGNQYSRVSEILGSGMSHETLEWQLIARARPGTVDTSALPMDLVSNPGTFNAIINFDKRPVHEHDIIKWHKASSCEVGADPAQCWCEPGKPGKCWQRLQQTQMVPNVLKGGEDSIGLLEAIQRVYFNIGSCAEQCWLNHVPDLRAADPSQRNYGQTPFDIGQCRRDCASFRAMEDRLGDVANFLLSGRPTDLYAARGYDDPRDLEVELEREFGAGSVERGRQVFAQTCARCHSSQKPPYDNVDFRAPDPNDPSRRIDWLGNDLLTPASEVGTFRGRALHSNHMKSRVWEQYASLTLQANPADPNLKEVMKGGGRGYYRNISLLSVWAHAPFLHNNAIGPEICGAPASAENQLYVSPYVDADGKPLANSPACWPYDTSVEGRYELYKASMDALLNPDKRIPKMHLLGTDMVVDIAPEIELGELNTGLSLRVPKGFPAGLINNLRFKDLIQDMVLLKTDRDKLAAKYDGILSDDKQAELVAALEGTINDFLANPRGYVLDLSVVQNRYIQAFYSNNVDLIDNAGHRFGENLSPADKAALTAFMATL